jgi:hypothetical protein
MRQPNENQPDPPGGRAASRRDEFLAARFGPGGPPTPRDPSGDPAAPEEPAAPTDPAQPEESSPAA